MRPLYLALLATLMLMSASAAEHAEVRAAARVDNDAELDGAHDARVVLARATQGAHDWRLPTVILGVAPTVDRPPTVRAARAIDRSLAVASPISIVAAARDPPLTTRSV